MLDTKKPEVTFTVSMLLQLAGEAEEEVAAGLAEEVVVKEEPAKAAQQAGLKKRPATAPPKAEAVGAPKKVPKVDPHAWIDSELGEYPNNIRLVSSSSNDNHVKLLEEAATATTVVYDIQWNPDFDGATDHPIGVLQMAFPNSGNSYVVQIPMLESGLPAEIRQMFESKAVTIVGFAANDTD